MTLYVCNASPRNHHLNYRIPDDDRVYDRIIKAGEQYKIPHDEAHQESSIIKQLESYGAVKPAKVSGDKHFSGLIYSERPIVLDDIRAGLETVDKNAIARALEHRTAAAVGSDQKMASEAQEMGAKASGLQISVSEQARSGVAADDLQRNTIEVARDGAKLGGKGKKRN